MLHTPEISPALLISTELYGQEDGNVPATFQIIYMVSSPAKLSA